jgi:hypothetical protein
VTPIRRAERAALQAHLDAIETWCEMTDGQESWPVTKGTQVIEAQSRMKITAREWWRTRRARLAAERA